MRIAILGATSQIASDLVLSFSAQGDHELTLYARRPEIVTEWLASKGLSGRHAVGDFTAFKGDRRFDAILNFVGVGNPAQALAMGASIFDVTLKYDDLALDYVRQHPDCRYIFLSSGAAYGSEFKEPADEGTRATIPINKLLPQDWYGVAKLHAECRHRANAGLPIFDLRVFSYVSRTQDTSGRFLINDIVRALHDGKPLIAAPDNIVRDFLHPDDFHAMVSAVLASPLANMPLDCYSRAPIDKHALLDSMKARFGLRFEFGLAPVAANATGLKPKYYSLSRRAEEFGYHPIWSSLDAVIHEVGAMLNRKVPHSNE